MLKNVFKELRTTVGAIIILLVWLAPKMFGIEIPHEIQIALSSIIGAVLLGLSRDPK